MAEFWDKLKTELDKAGKVAQEALDEGKLRIELFRVRQAADKNAQALGYAVYRARKAGSEPERESHDRLMRELAEQDAEMTRLEAAIKSLGTQEASASSSAGAESTTGADSNQSTGV